ncbi:MAG: sensor histidine kinase [Solirubrobacteraceae bacterium]
MDLRVDGVQWVYAVERERLRARLCASVLPGLQRLADADRPVADLIASADRQARHLRADLEQRARASDEHRATLAGIDAPVAAAREEAREWVRGHLHDTVLQILEFIAGDGLGTRLSSSQIAVLAASSARDLRCWLDTPVGVSPVGLVAELEQLAGEAGRLGSMGVELIIGPIDHPPAGEQAAALVGAAREALTNARKHAWASQVIVYVEARDGAASITVTDDGVGIDGPHGLGLQGSIVGRMRRAGGRAAIQRAPGGGTRIHLMITAAGGNTP